MEKTLYFSLSIIEDMETLEEQTGSCNHLLRSLLKIRETESSDPEFQPLLKATAREFLILCNNESWREDKKIHFPDAVIQAKKFFAEELLTVLRVCQGGMILSVE